MKWKAAILSIYTVSLIFWPCSDNFTHKDLEVKVERNAEMDHSHFPQEQDHCSPFCFCHCCHTCSISLDLHVKLNHYNPVTVYTNPYDNPDLKSFSSSIFHPPKG